MPEIQIIAKDNHKTLVTTEGTSAKLSEASVVLVKVAASDVLVVNREGTNAVIRLKNGETIVIEGFFSGTAEPKDNSLVFQDENGQLIWAKFKDAENDADADSDADADADSDVEPQALLGEDLPAALPAEAPQELVSDVIYQPISSIEPLLYHDAGVNPWLWAAIPLVAGGIIAAASNHDSNDDSSTPTDTTPPATPSVPSGYLDNVGPDQGIKGSGSSTDDTTPGVVISAPGAGETPTLYVDGEKVAASYDPVTGTLTPTTPLADGSHQLTYTLTDAAGNESAQSPAITVTVDTLAPATPSVPSGYLDNVGPDQGIKGSGSSTDDTTPGVVISAPGAGETPTLYVDGEKVAASYDPVTGTLTPTTPLADGSHQLTYTLTDAAGNESAQSPAITVTVDTLAPATPSVPSGYLDNVGPDQGIKGSGSSTDDTTPGVVISAPGAGETPTLYVDGEKVAASYDPVTGTLTPTTPLADGSHQLTYTLTDAAGNESAQSPAITVTVDTTAPVLTISTSDLVLASGEAATITFEFSEPVSEFSVSDVVVSGGVLSNFIQVDANTWTAIFTQSGSVAPSISVADGAYTDIVGNTGKGDVLDGADGFIFNPLAVDLIGEITIPADINNDNILNANELGADKTFTAQITLGSDAAVGNIISVNGINYTVVQADLDAGFITAEIIVTVDGDLSVRAEARDSAGNTDIADTTIKVITVDTTAPITPSAPTGYLDNVGPDQGIKGSGSSTDDTTPGVVISAPGAGETPTLYVDGEKVAASYDPVTGTLTPTTPLADGSHQLTYTLTDAAGNESVQSPALLLTVDTTAPSLVITALDPALTATESTTISFTFSEAVSGFDIDDITPVGGTLSNLVQSTTNPNVWTATFTADGSGAAPSISVADGAYTDLAGNLGTGDVLDGTDGFVVDTLAPAPVITIDPVTNAITIDFGEAVNAVDGSPLTADALEGLLDIANGTLTGLVDNGDGSFSGTLVPAADFEGDVVVNVPAGIVTDVAGNANLTATESLTVDTLAPGLVITALDPALTATESTTISFTFSEAVSGFDIDDITPVGGTLSNLVQSTTNPNVWTATFTADGSGAAPSISVADGAYTDLAGNLGTGDVLDGTDGFVVDTLAPAPVITIDPVTNAITIDFGEAVNAVDGSPLTADALEGLLDIANGTLTSLVDNGNGSFSGTLVPAADFEGDVVVNVPAGIVTDVAGNANLTATESLTVDTLAPGLVITALDPALTATESTTISFTFSEAVSGFDIDDITPVGGTLSNLVQSTTNPNVWTATFTADGSGAAPSISVADGAYTDLAGNLGTGDVLDGTDGFVVDTLAPAPVITIDPVTNAITIDFGEAVNAVDGSPLTADALEGLLDIANGTLTGLVDNGDGSFSGTLVPAADFEGDVVVNVPAGIVTDVAGNANLTATESLTVDTLAPAFDFTVTINADGTATIAGSTEPGATVEILDPAGNPVAVTVAADGTISGSIAAPALAGDYTGTATDVNGNPATDTATAVDTTAPAFDFTVTINADGTATIAGSTEPGATVEILDPAGNPVAVTVAADGTISGSIAAPALAGDYTGTATDVNGNPATDTATAVDTTAPAFDFTVTINADGTATIAGSTEPGATVEILDPAGNPVAVTVAADGTISGSIAAPALAGDYTGTATDVNGNPATDTATAVDTTAPAFDFTVTINADGTATIAGSTEPGATVEILDPAGNPVTVTVAADGTISGSIAAPALAGDYTGTATDVNGNPATDTATAVDTTAPAFDFTVTINADGTATIAGSTEPGATVEILDPAGNPVAVTVAADGTISGSIAAPALAGDYTGTATDVNGNPATDTATAVALDTIDAINDNVTFDPGTFVSTIWDAPIIAQDINVLDTSIIGDTSMNVEFSVPRNSADIGTGHEGDVVIQVSQDNLIAVASGFSVLVEYFDGANWVQYTTATTTNGGLIADALGLGVLGIVDDGKTIAVHLTGVPEGQYRVVVQNDSSAIGDLLDDLTLAQLGDQGILLGADNQDAVLDAVETALNGQVLNLGTLVRNVLEPLLNIANAAGETLAVTDIVAAIVKIPLVGSLLGGVDTVLDYIADALVDNLLSVLEFTNVTINGSETYYTTPQVSGNVFDDNGSGADDRGNSDAALVTKVDGVDVPTDGTDAVIKGLYGTLYINKDGVYRYVLNGSVDSNGQVDDFTYTLSDGTQSDTAVLTISVADVIAPKAPIVSSLDETTVTGVAGAAEANSVINVYGGTDSDGDGIPDTLLGTTTANPDGSYTVTLNPAIALGDTVVVTSKDAAGNISTPTIASLHNIVALDDPNQTNYELSTTADRPNISGGIFTLANAGVLGDLIDLDLSATSAPGVTVGTNEQITLTLTASGSTGLDISAVGNLIDAILGGNIGGSLDLIIAKQTSTGSYEVYNTIANAYTLNNNVLTFTASGSQSISLDDAGVYKFILAPNSSTSSALSNLLSLNLLGNLILSSNDVVATINNTDLITGNVLSNDTAAPIGLDLSIVSIKETTAGVDETVVSGTPKVIEGMYGTLTIDSTGAYSYQMTANATALGKVEAFTYTVQDNDGHSKQATIYIRLDSNLVTLDWTGKTGLEEANKLVTQLTADNKASAGTVTTLFDQVLNGSGDSSNSIQVTGSNGVLPTSPPETGSTAIPDDSGRFTLGAGQTAYISFTSILPSNVTQDFGFLGGGNQTSAYNVVIELERDGGTLAFDTQLATWTSTTSGTKYYYKVTNTGNSSANYDLNIGYGDGSIAYNWTNTTGKTFGINNIQLDIKDTTYTASSVSGDLISNDILYSSVFKIGVAAGSTTPSNYLDANSTPIVGAYGTLTVNLDGTYSYQANGKIADLGKDDVFTYKIETLDGTVNTQTLTIKVDADNVLIGTPDAGTTGNDIAVSQSANEVFTLGDGADLLIYNVLNGSSPTGGNGTDQWLDFNMSEGDKIDVSSLLSGATTDNINNYLSVSISGNQVTLLVDRDGSSGGISTPTALLTLTNEDHATNPITSLVDLLNNNSIIY
ncbi:BapA prefix-like domain-containing protein [Acinetobacter baumannii]|nr:Ig-like domain-containing protein [Acinetobacter baumannii]QUD79678.1 BapA prefix-like domain-containing protein [Acinetobacter baumannii]